MNHEISNVREILKDRSRHLLKMQNVVATGIGYKMTAGQKTPNVSIVCSVKEKLPVSQLTSKNMVPPSFDGVPTDVIRTGHIRALGRTDRTRPAPGGVSLGHIDITAGTLGCLVKKNNQIFILSNNHVMANSNNAQIGDPILQPGPYDGGTDPQDRIATLSEFVPVSFVEVPSGCSTSKIITAILNGLAAFVGSDVRFKPVSTKALTNLIDAAIARPVNDSDVINEIMEIGPIQGVIEAELGMAIKKSGRTTGLTTGEITQVDVTSTVGYGGSNVAIFTDQLMAGAMSQGGDSGSAVLSSDDKLTGLLFAGSDSSTVMNRIQNVFTAFGVTLV